MSNKPNKTKAKSKKIVALAEKTTLKEIKLNKANPVDRLEEIIGKVRVHYKNEGDQDGYLWIKDIELVGGNALLKGLPESSITKLPVAWNGNGQIRRLVLESVFRDHVDGAGSQSSKTNTTTTPSVKDELSSVTKVKPGKPDMSVVPNAHAKVTIETKGLNGSVLRINTLVTKKELEAHKVITVPQTFAEIKALVRPMVDIQFEVKSKAIGDYCKAYTSKLIEQAKLTKADLKATDRWAYREPRRLLYTEFERIFAADPAVKEFIKSRKALPDGNDTSYIRAIYAAGLIDRLLELAQAAFEDYVPKATSSSR
jgi:phage host-nuclease inhibitor protein Gam